MKPVELIRLGIIGIALLLGYYCIIHLVELISFLPDYIDGDKPSGKGFIGVLFRIAGSFAAAWLLIKNNRKISNFIEEQK